MLLLTNEYLLRPVQKYFLHWSLHPTLIQSFLLKPNFYHKTFDVNEQCLFCKFGIKYKSEKDESTTYLNLFENPQPSSDGFAEWYRMILMIPCYFYSHWYYVH